MISATLATPLSAVSTVVAPGSGVAGDATDATLACASVAVFFDWGHTEIVTSGGQANAIVPMMGMPLQWDRRTAILAGRANKKSPEGLSMKFQRLALSLVHERGELFKL